MSEDRHFSEPARSTKEKVDRCSTGTPTRLSNPCTCHGPWSVMCVTLWVVGSAVNTINVIIQAALHLHEELKNRVAPRRLVVHLSGPRGSVPQPLLQQSQHLLLAPHAVLAQPLHVHGRVRTLLSISELQRVLQLPILQEIKQFLERRRGHTPQRREGGGQQLGLCLPRCRSAGTSL